MKYNIIIFPGSNCDYDNYYVLKNVMNEVVEFVWHKDSQLKAPDCVILPGGFSYGDYLRAGAIAKFSPIMSEIVRFAKRGGLVIGICNGFQILTEAELLPGTLIQNRSLLFVCRHQYVKVVNKDTPFTNKFKEGDVRDIPMAHNTGNYFIDNDGLKQLYDNHQIVFQYCDSQGEVTEQANPNGSVANIAGIVNTQKNVLGIMPHPERATDPVLKNTDGKALFQSIANYLTCLSCKR